MGISLLTAIDSTSHIHLIIGSNPLAAARCAKSLEVGAKPIVIAPETPELHYGLQKRIDDGSVMWLKKSFEEKDLSSLGREENGGFVDAVFVTTGPRDPSSVHVSNTCRKYRVPVNVADAPQLCTFSLLATHTDGPLQIGVTTNGKGCKLSSRIRREIASSLPPDLGSACARLGTMRRRIQTEDHLTHPSLLNDIDEEDSLDQSSSFNKLVTEADLDAAKSRRIRWLSQICEYWPLRRLAAISDVDVDTILNTYASKPDATYNTSPESNTLALRCSSRQSVANGRIILAGSGPGHPDLLTRATHKAILAADLILADKLVPSGVLELIPRRTPVHIARKFPGNADRAQEELLSLGLAGLEAGKTVLRLKQGDPYLYGRGGEEVEFFEKEGYTGRITVLPGVTSALSAPLFAGIPVTQRAVADQVLVCTGTGRKGVPSKPPEYVSSRTVVFLMALHRIASLVEDLSTHELENASLSNGEAADPSIDPSSSLQDPLLRPSNHLSRSTPPESPHDAHLHSHHHHTRSLWPLSTPCAVIERASCPDQRVIRTTLEFVTAAIEEEGSRPPGLLVLGSACEVLVKPDGRRRVVEEGFKGWDWLDDIGVGNLGFGIGVENGEEGTRINGEMSLHEEEAVPS